MPYTSIHGRKVGFDSSGLLFDGRPVGAFLPRGPKGKVFFVDSAIDATEGTSPETAVGTLDEAFALTTANQGDVIYVMPNHAETVTGAGGITHDVAGVSVIGLGTHNNRPRFLMDGGTSVTYVITAADAYLENLVFAAGHNGVVTCFGVTSTGATFRNIEIEDNTTDEHFLAIISCTGAANTADGLTVDGLKWVSIDAGCTNIVSMTDNIDRLTIRNVKYVADAATGAGVLHCATGKGVTGLVFENNVMVCGNTAGDLLIDNDVATNTGYAFNNFCGHHDTAGSVLIDCDGIRLFRNEHASSDTESGVIQPAIDTNT